MVALTMSMQGASEHVPDLLQEFKSANSHICQGVGIGLPSACLIEMYNNMLFWRAAGEGFRRHPRAQEGSGGAHIPEWTPAVIHSKVDGVHTNLLTLTLQPSIKET